MKYSDAIQQIHNLVSGALGDRTDEGTLQAIQDLCHEALPSKYQQYTNIQIILENAFNQNPSGIRRRALDELGQLTHGDWETDNMGAFSWHY